MIRVLPIFLALALISCASETSRSGKPIVSISILPQGYFLEQLAGDLVELNVLVPSGASPATYEPTLSQLTSLKNSEVYLRVGHIGFEMAWLDRISSVNPEMKIINVSKGIALIEEDHHHGEEGHNGDDHHQGDGHHHGGIDPHTWMSVSNARIIARNSYDALVQILPNQKELLAKNLRNLTADLDSLDRELSEMLEPLAGHGFMIYHPALTYFARDYKLTQHSLEEGGKEPSPAHMKEMIDLGRASGTTAIFIQRQFDRRNAEVLAREIGANIVQIDPLDPEWFSQMHYIAETLSRKP